MNQREEILRALKKLHSLMSACNLEVTDQLNVLELKLAQIHQIRIIAKTEHLTFGQFADILGVTKPSVTEIINKLIQQDCVTKNRCSKDGRIFYIGLTEKGNKIASQETLRDEIVSDKILEVLDETELFIFIRCIDKISC
ncbi:MAG: winged helix-turn-helix transcriptional regulator [Proteobacteria bacterium]|nr:winged helix-turn-helix transcriptional regulator [Pseudomonadota bacterium]